MRGTLVHPSSPMTVSTTKPQSINLKGWSEVHLKISDDSVKMWSDIQDFQVGTNYALLDPNLTGQTLTLKNPNNTELTIWFSAETDSAVISIFGVYEGLI